MIGKTTWGGLVRILGFPEFIDGGSVTAPNVAIWTEDGFIVENVGVEPDIEVEQMPKDLIEGRDPQLEKAIEVIMSPYVCLHCKEIYNEIPANGMCECSCTSFQKTHISNQT